MVGDEACDWMSTVELSKSMETIEAHAHTKEVMLMMGVCSKSSPMGRIICPPWLELATRRHDEARRNER
jgi:hypothetical protein